MSDVTHTDADDPLAPLWKKAEEAAARGDMPGVLYTWKALAEQGVWQLLARIGELYERGAEGVEPNIEQALSWYRRAVYEGDDALGHLGLVEPITQALGRAGISVRRSITSEKPTTRT
jgi:TPR repeat protein